MVYAATLSESQTVIRWQPIIKEFGPNIQNISGVDNIVADTLSILPYTYVNKYKPSTVKDQCRVNELFTISRAENNKYPPPPLNLLNVQR